MLVISLFLIFLFLSFFYIFYIFIIYVQANQCPHVYDNRVIYFIMVPTHQGIVS